MGGERASSTRMRYAGKICCECKMPLPVPHYRGERLCERCGGADRKRVYMRFKFRCGWFCEFLKDDRKTVLPLKLLLNDGEKIFEIANRGGFTLDIAGRREIEEALRKRGGGIWLELTGEQYEKLLKPS
jgi:hypothetical protein